MIGGVVERFSGREGSGVVVSSGELFSLLVISLRRFEHERDDLPDEFHMMIDPLADFLIEMQIPWICTMDFYTLKQAVEASVAISCMGVSFEEFARSMSQDRARDMVVRLVSSPEHYKREAQKRLALFHPDRTSQHLRRLEENMRRRMADDSIWGKTVVTFARQSPNLEAYESWRDAVLDGVVRDIARIWPDAKPEA